MLYISLTPVKAWQRLHLSAFPNTEAYLSDEAHCCDIKQACISVQSGALRAEATSCISTKCSVNTTHMLLLLRNDTESLDDAALQHSMESKTAISIVDKHQM